MTVYTEDNADIGISSLEIHTNLGDTTLLIDSDVYHSESVNDSIPDGSAIAHVHLFRDYLVPIVLSELEDADLASFGPLLRQVGVDGRTTFGLMGREVPLKARPGLSAAFAAARKSGEVFYWEVAKQVSQLMIVLI